MNAQQNKTALANYALSKIGGKIFNFGDGSTSDVVMSAIMINAEDFLLRNVRGLFVYRLYSLQLLRFLYSLLAIM